jgi:protein TonB
MIKQDIYSDSWCDIVFEDRNKEYGAYVLRKQDRRNTTIAILISVGIFVFVFALPAIIKLLTPEDKGLIDTSFKVETTLIEAPPLDNKPPPPPVEPPPPLKSTIKFTPPKVAEHDEDVEEPPPTQEQLKVEDAGQETQEGDSLGVDPSLGDGNDLVEEDNSIYDSWQSIEQQPEFQGGVKKMYEFLYSKATPYPPMCRENGIQGTVTISFVVNKDGSIQDVTVVRGIAGGKALDELALKAVKAMPPWKPGKQNGNAVRVKFSLPMKFVLK